MEMGMLGDSEQNGACRVRNEQSEDDIGFQLLGLTIVRHGAAISTSDPGTAGRAHGTTDTWSPGLQDPKPPAVSSPPGGSVRAACVLSRCSHA